MCIMCARVHVHVHVYVYKTAGQHLNFSFLSNLLPPSEGNTEEAALSTPLTPAVSFPAATFPPLLLAVGSQVAQWFHQLHAEITLLLMCNSGLVISPLDVQQFSEHLHSPWADSSHQLVCHSQSPLGKRLPSWGFLTDSPAPVTSS